MLDVVLDGVERPDDGRERSLLTGILLCWAAFTATPPPPPSPQSLMSSTLTILSTGQLTIMIRWSMVTLTRAQHRGVHLAGRLPLLAPRHGASSTTAVPFASPPSFVRSWPLRPAFFKSSLAF